MTRSAGEPAPASVDEFDDEAMSEELVHEQPDQDERPSPGPFPRFFPWLLLVGGVVGWLAALVLTLEKMALLRDPDYQPSCSINPILSCGSVMNEPQAAAFGFPNPLLGVTGFAVVATVGAVLLAGGWPRRWFWLGLQAGVTFGFVFVHWLIFQSLYRIGALCPYCMVVWAVTFPIFWYVTLHNVEQRWLPVPQGARRFVPAVVDYHSLVVFGWFVVILGLIGVRFWNYWSTFVG